jgi:hypothetical protein
MSKESPEQVIEEYQKRIEEQTHILFALVAKLGGKVNLTTDDFNSFPGMNMVNAEVEEDGSLTLEIGLHEE